MNKREFKEKSSIMGVQFSVQLKTLIYCLMSLMLINTGHADLITKYIDQAIISKDNQQLAINSFSRDKDTISLWDITQLPYKKLVSFDFNHERHINDLTFSNNNIYLAAGIDNIVYVWDTRDHKLLRTIKISGSATTVKFSEDNRYLVVGGTDYTVFVWDVENDFTLIDQIGGQKSSFLDQMFPKYNSKDETRACALDFSEDNRFLLVGYEDKNTQVFDATNDFKIVKDLQNDDTYGCDAHFGHDFIITSSENTSEVFDSMPPFMKNKVLSDSSEDLYSAALSSNHKYYITSGGYNGEIKLFDSEDNFSHRATFAGHTQYTTSLQFFQDDRYIVSAGGDDSVKIWRIDDQELVGKVIINDHDQLVYEQL